MIVDVSPTGVDDTENIQCALDEGERKGVPIVRLGKGEFAISQIFVENFKGNFQGTTRSDTRLTIMDNSIDCFAIRANGRMDAVIKFAGGEPKVKFMTINSDTPCKFVDTIRAIIHFTGKPTSDASCSNDVIFALVDRVDMIGPGRRQGKDQAAIQASPEGLFGSDTCKQTLLGTFKVNQSKVTGYENGVLTSMKSGAQVDINFNTFTNNRYAINVLDSNQTTSITGNTFTSQNEDLDLVDLVAIIIQKRNNTAPDVTRAVVHNNQFMKTDVEGIDDNGFRGSVVTTSFGLTTQKISLSLTNNRFQVTGSNLNILNLRDISDWTVSGNLFSGNVSTGIDVFNIRESSVSGGVIVANTFNNLNAKFNDIWLDKDTTECIVGPGQGATVDDNGVGNNVL